jgi:hypothetical protein
VFAAYAVLNVENAGLALLILSVSVAVTPDVDVNNSAVWSLNDCTSTVEAFA